MSTKPYPFRSALTGETLTNIPLPATDDRPNTECKRLATEYRPVDSPIWTITGWRTPSGQAFSTVHHVSGGLIHTSAYGE